MVTFFALLFLLSFEQTQAQSPSEFVPPKQEYYKGQVTQIIKEGSRDIEQYKNFFQFIEVKFLEGPEKGKTVTFENGGSLKMVEQKSLKAGDQIIVLKVTQNDKVTYSVWDKLRLNYIYFAVIAFFALILIFAGVRGIGSILGMIISFGILIGFIVPQILAGADPLLVSIEGSLVIMFVTIYLAHGVSKRTTSAVISTFISLTLVGILAFIFVKIFHLTGLGDENSYLLQMRAANINPQGLLLGGIIIGALGVLDDITTTQSAAVFELFKLNRKLSITDLFIKGYTIGREHIASLVNTLILAYVGVSLGLFVIFVLNPNNTPVWVILNSEMLSEEIVRSIAGSIGLILAVPITTLIASFIAKRDKDDGRK